MEDKAITDEENMYQIFFSSPLSPLSKAPAARRPSGTPLKHTTKSFTPSIDSGLPRRKSEPVLLPTQESDEWATFYCGDVNASKKLAPVRISKLANQSPTKVDFAKNPNVTKPSQKFKHRRHSMPAIIEIVEAEACEAPGIGSPLPAQQV